MPGPLDGRTVALAEGRQLEELAALLEAEGAAVLRCPLLSILDAPDPAPVEAWIDELVAGKFGLVILMTGEAVRRLSGFAGRAGRREPFVQALGRVPTLSRGPKPVAALRELGLKASKVASPPTTDGVLDSLRGEDLRGQAVGVTLYGSDNPRLTDFLASAGATPRPVMPYVFAPASDDERVVGLITRLAQGAIGVLVFTSTPQVERLWEVAQKRGLAAPLQQGLARTKVAAVGPLVADALRKRGAPVHICPEQGWVMKNLVRQIARSEAT
ncbi:MAG: uroporphyrinogen-III synthase [Gemmataceae bacterium]